MRARLWVALVVVGCGWLGGVARVARAEDAPLAPTGQHVVWSGGTVVASPGGPAITVDGTPPYSSQIVVAPGGTPVEPGDLVPVRISEDPELTVWLRTADLKTVITEEVRPAKSAAAALKPARAVAADRPDLVLLPEAVVTVLEKKAGAARVSFDNGLLKVEGWVPDRAMAIVYSPTADEPVPPGEIFECDATTFLDAPGGRPKFTFAHPPVFVRREAQRAKHSLITWTAAGLRVRGWVPDATLRRSRGILGLVRGSPGPGKAIVKVPAGTPLLDRIGGTPVGKFLSLSYATEVERKDGHTRFRLRSRLGPIELWAPFQARPEPCVPITDCTRAPASKP
jgi:hypothetical protein